MSTITLDILDASPSRCNKTRREDLKPGECLCTYCTAKCCRYFALPIDKPTTWRDFDHMRWFLLHEKASVFVEEGDWYLLSHNVDASALAQAAAASGVRQGHATARHAGRPALHPLPHGHLATPGEKPALRGTRGRRGSDDGESPESGG